MVDTSARGRPARRRRGALAVLVLGSALNLACGTTTIETLLTCPSPDGKVNAIYYWLYGGGAAGWANMRVSLQPAQTPLKAQRYAFEMTGGIDVRLRWTGPANC